MKQNKTFIPDHLIANRPKVLKLIGKLAMKVTGWKTVGHFPKDERVLLVAGPHTSNWDFVLAMSLILSLDVNFHWIGKHSVFKKGFRTLLRKMGGIPVNRANPAALKQEIQNVTDKYKGFLIVIAPEGTRQKVKRLKSGFLRIANETNSQIMMAGIDFSNKTIELGDFFSPTGNVEQDLESIREYFSNFSGKRPEFF
ncbi:1-acyl-sn-glycerol-3-phosphate acyltransferase [Gammaproteobacteria bacterium]|nr:1-acyl-sn-glycerol-3-phosphate acyltransferase [Gammaproteobacteria bacterium]MDB9783518.1 1-acyl-sn-glycerol-3-phosphate acyltransferase [Gammaproteobacteria bacterium]MDB9939847.1 1-acyl-sn-glycerol-3-phosphate acyltransferase [Gammaproteobacteria bacterium]MDC0891412.1 1-acyl-sn-glycerol-3-phosphate acyltransferase [Gammaproteobacteria bacterium]MDC1008971.1 1-acyl-sn-glycerol-3-phosphate acyltransferase [Gammaproteobacteria bacterium]